MPQGSPPTAAQTAWLKANKAYARMSHVRHVVQFSNRGTLQADGSFVAESGRTPVMDGNGAFGVGIVVVRKRRR